MDKEIPKHQKKSPGRKTFLIQCRFKTFSGDWGSWHTWHRYAKEESRDQALATLQTKVDFGGYGKGQVEFRRGE